MSDILIGIHATARSGKDTIADYLVNNYGFTRVSLADEVRECLYILNPIVIINGVFVRLQEVVDTQGWEVAKGYPEVRELLQRMGTDVGRNKFGEDVWINKANVKLTWSNRVVVPDIRFENESDWIRDVGDFININQFNNRWLIKTTRPNFGSINNHVSDKGLSKDYWDVEIINDGTLEDLYQKIDRFMESI